MSISGRLPPLAALLCAGCSLLGVAPLEAQSTAPAAVPAHLSFEVASIKPSKPDDPHNNFDSSPGRLTIEHISLPQLIMFAYGLRSRDQVIGGPKWIDSRYFDIVAKENDAELMRRNALPRGENGEDVEDMTQALLADRFSLKVTEAERKLPAFALLQTRAGAAAVHLTVASGSISSLSVHNNHLQAGDRSMAQFAAFLAQQREFSSGDVVDRTNLPGAYDFTLNWSPQQKLSASPSDTYTPSQPASADELPDLITALREQLGLVVKRREELVPVVVIDAASEPSPN